MKLVFEKGAAGRKLDLISPCDVPRYRLRKHISVRNSPAFRTCRKMKSAAIIRNWQSVPTVSTTVSILWVPAP